MVSGGRTSRTLQRVTSSPRTPVVPLEAGAGPDNPPCPACGEPLFGWLSRQENLGAPVRRCESCGLGVVGNSAGPEEALAALTALGGRERATIPNRASWACSLGGAGWAGLEPGAHYLFTVEAARRLVAGDDQVVRARRWAPGPSLLATWQTLLNSVTFGHNIALGALGKGRSAPAADRWQRRIDAVATVIGAIPAAVIALPVELAGAALRKGAVIRLRFELL